MSEARIVLVRHGQSQWNAAKRFQGHAGPGLTDLGELQAKLTAETLDASYSPVSLIVRSDLPRVAETAAPAEALLAAPVEVDPRWREIDLGSWTGRTREEVARESPDVVEAWRRGEDIVPGGGEPVTALRTRVLEALDDLRGRLRRETAVVFTHGGPLRVVAAILAGQHGAEPVQPGARNCSLTVLREDSDNRLALVEYNDTSHLVGLG